MKILAINPGSTSTKIAVFEDSKQIMTHTIRHSVEELSKFKRVIDQLDYRRELVLKALADEAIPFEFDAVIGRGGLTHPIPGGVYDVNNEMVEAMYRSPRDHACNLGSLIAHDIAREIDGCRAFIADPGIVDEMDDIAHITGSPIMPRITTWHALNQRAIGRRFASDYSEQHPDAPKRYREMNLIICHLGGGISIGAHDHGRCIDVNNAFDGEGPFSPERAGTLPSGSLIDLCYSGRYTKEELKKRISGKAGLAAHLGTVSIPEIVERIDGGDEHARLVLDAMIYQIAKNIAALSPVLYGKIDAILITGGIAYSDYVISRLRKRVEFLAPVYVYPGEDELEALALNAVGALQGDLEIKTFHLPETSDKKSCARQPEVCVN
ncbi:MAG: butyrate kinase [Muribaculaceae bacterium]|nr:butyrate kinase [Muribaculaceae bacterium]